jgi:aminoacrylate hydrolase
VWRTLAKAAGLYFEDHGPSDAPPLILSAGMGGSGGYWKPNLPALTEAHRVILYDHRGTARSDPMLPDEASIEAMARDVVLLMDYIGVDRTSLVGHALGGVVGLALARIAPERLHKLVMVNGWARTDVLTMRCFQARLHILKSGGPEAYLQAQPIFLFPATWISENDGRLYDEIGGHLEHFPDNETLMRRIGMLMTFDASEWIGALTTPTLALASRDDMLAPYTASEALAAANDNITLSLMEWGGHACNVTDPDTFNRIVLDFLRS